MVCFSDFESGSSRLLEPDQEAWKNQSQFAIVSGFAGDLLNALEKAQISQALLQVPKVSW